MGARTGRCPRRNSCSIDDGLELAGNLRRRQRRLLLQGGHVAAGEIIELDLLARSLRGRAFAREPEPQLRRRIADVELVEHGTPRRSSDAPSRRHARQEGFGMGIAVFAPRHDEVVRGVTLARAFHLHKDLANSGIAATVIEGAAHEGLGAGTSRAAVSSFARRHGTQRLNHAGLLVSTVVAVVLQRDKMDLDGATQGGHAHFRSGPILAQADHVDARCQKEVARAIPRREHRHVQLQNIGSNRFPRCRGPTRSSGRRNFQLCSHVHLASARRRALADVESGEPRPVARVISTKSAFDEVQPLVRPIHLSRAGSAAGQVQRQRRHAIRKGHDREGKVIGRSVGYPETEDHLARGAVDFRTGRDPRFQWCRGLVRCSVRALIDDNLRLPHEAQVPRLEGHEHGTLLLHIRGCGVVAEWTQNGFRQPELQNTSEERCRGDLTACVAQLHKPGRRVFCLCHGCNRPGELVDDAGFCGNLDRRRPHRELNREHEVLPCLRCQRHSGLVSHVQWERLP
mmetsp:Transcript_76329/g.212086  ORF Transcript_76329/g.212086 Transcript_76329/m.212086 type:complete len:513 (-) Transcript_76329:122-1660(-)